MAGNFRESALNSLSTPGDQRPRTQLIPARRWLIAVAVIALMIAGAMYLAVGTLRAPVRGIGVVDEGGIQVITAPGAGAVDFAVGPGDAVAVGQTLGTLTTEDGTALEFTSPVKGVVMQFKGPGRGWPVADGDQLMILAATDRRGGPELDLYLPGEQATELTAGTVQVGAPVWFETTSYGDVRCTVKSVDPYPIPVEDVLRFNTNPVLAQAVTELGSVLMAEADCPGGELQQMLPRTVARVVVQMDENSPLSIIFGTG